MTTTTHAKGETHSMNMLVIGDQVYSWNGRMGLMTMKKTSQPAPKSPGNNIPTPPKSSGLDKNYEYKCDKQNVGQSVFSVPTNVDFKTPQTMDYF